MRRNTFFALMLAGLFTLAGCSCNARGARSLYLEAKLTHGDCSIVSESESDELTEVVLHDKLQDFDYKVVSSKTDINIDGANFGSAQHTTDYFKTGLKQMVLDKAGTEIDQAVNGRGLRYETDLLPTSDVFVCIFAEDKDKGIEAALEVAGIVQELNVKNRLDGMWIKVSNGDEQFGSVKLPDVKWRDPDDEMTDYYMEQISYQIDQKVEFLRKEQKTFADTGVDINSVHACYESCNPDSPDSPVTYYYFRAEDGKEYYMCDFMYTTNMGYNLWFSNHPAKNDRS